MYIMTMIKLKVLCHCLYCSVLAVLTLGQKRGLNFGPFAWF